MDTTLLGNTVTVTIISFSLLCYVTLELTPTSSYFSQRVTLSNFPPYILYLITPQEPHFLNIYLILSHFFPILPSPYFLPISTYLAHFSDYIYIPVFHFMCSWLLVLLSFTFIIYLSLSFYLLSFNSDSFQRTNSSCNLLHKNTLQRKEF